MKTDLFIYLLTDGIIDRRQQNDLFHTCGTAMKKKNSTETPSSTSEELCNSQNIHVDFIFFFSHPMPIKKLECTCQLYIYTKFSEIPMISSDYLCHLVLVSLSCKFIARIAAINYFSSACNCQSESGCISPAVI